MVPVNFNAGVAQQVEQLICNQPVAGSIPVTSSIFSNPRGFGMEASHTSDVAKSYFKTHARGHRGRTIGSAVRHAMLITFLLGLAACDAQDPPTVSLYLATQRGDLDQLERHIYWQSDINQPFPDGRYPLHTAAAQGRISLIQALLEHQATLEVRDAADRTPIELAILAGRIQIAERLRQAGANLAATPLLLIAAEQGSQDRDVVRYLVEHGADLEATNAAGETALLVAIKKQNHRLVAHLLAQGANVNAQNAQGWSALQLARDQHLTEIQQRLRRYGAR